MKQTLIILNIEVWEQHSVALEFIYRELPTMIDWCP
jgi:hypothetical protein